MVGVEGTDGREAEKASPFDRLVALIARLRDPETGCPWDCAQDHRSLRPYLLEEAYETIAAIDAADPAGLAGELGDVLLQVLLHSRIAEEQGEFAIDDVIDLLARKLTRRHPHVFGAASNDLPSIYRRWEEIKAQEKGRTGGAEKGPSASLPILVRARKTVFSLAKLEKGHLIDELRAGGTEEEEAGARLLGAIEDVWRAGFDPELVLRKTLDRLEKAAG